jgi:hypothetical protein
MHAPASQFDPQLVEVFAHDVFPELLVGDDREAEMGSISIPSVVS